MYSLNDGCAPLLTKEKECVRNGGMIRNIRVLQICEIFVHSRAITRTKYALYGEFTAKKCSINVSRYAKYRGKKSWMRNPVLERRTQSLQNILIVNRGLRKKFLWVFPEKSHPEKGAHNSTNSAQIDRLSRSPSG